MKRLQQFLLTLLCTTAVMGCGHTHVSKVALLSLGDLEGKTIPATLQGPIVTGSDASHDEYLSDAVRDALKDSPYDTIINAEVTSTTNLLVWWNSLEVKGTAVDSKKLPTVTRGAK